MLVVEVELVKEKEKLILLDLEDLVEVEAAVILQAHLQ
jgi:hypothetical protein